LLQAEPLNIYISQNVDNKFKVIGLRQNCYSRFYLKMQQ